jgi:rhodanese-related sulfurtransferase
MTYTHRSAQETHQQHAQGTAYLIDVRTPAEYRAVHAQGAQLMPLDALDVAAVKTSIPAGSMLHVLCKSGNRAKIAAEKLIAAGCACVVVEGGTDAWEKAGLPVVHGKKSMSLERQVRIAAGFLALSGVVLGFTVHPNWFGLSGFVGAGLMFAGITDTCMMGMLIAKCPWNK